MRISDWSSDVCSSDLGDIYVLDRQTGEPLFPVEERPVPGGGVEPEQRARTQPFSTYATLRKPDLTDRDMWGLTPLDQLACRMQFRRASYSRSEERRPGTECTQTCRIRLSPDYYKQKPNTVYI